MIGFYNYTVILTYMSLVSSIIGMTLAHAGKFGAAVFCLALSGFFDMFDGKVARRKTDRTDDEKLFGIQLDSLCDVVAFGAFPAFLCYCMGVTGRIGFLAIAFYSVSGVIVWHISTCWRQIIFSLKRKNTKKYIMVCRSLLSRSFCRSCSSST